MRIGSVEIQPLFDGYGREQAGEIISRFNFPDAWRCHPESFGHDGHWEFPVGGFLIRTGERIIVLDTGVGPMDDGSYKGGGLIAQLASFGVRPTDVTDVLFSHLHFDHIGWASRDARPVFPNATYRVHERDWRHFMDGEAKSAVGTELLSPIQNQLELFTADFEIAPHVSTRFSPGHTPGSTVFVIASEQQRAILLGDIVHSTVQLSEPDWTVIWDVDPLAASRVRNDIADDAEKTGDLLVAAHFPKMQFGRVLRVEGIRKFVAL
ncbi:MBL fold metallo-hydrolase [Glutamicibacter sp. NPDC087344]|uniref:MBL fold metallo-hydrolase n=1 Tax=Glutamicibacter sp. NPDC087344 TaxID=3363994 RepID=UPI0037F11339